MVEDGLGVRTGRLQPFEMAVCHPRLGSALTTKLCKDFILLYGAEYKST